MTTTKETILIGGHPVNVSYRQNPHKVSITIAPHLPVPSSIYAVLSSAARQWLDQLAFDLYGCESTTSDHGNSIGIDICCLQKEESLVRAIPSLHALLRIQSLDGHHEPATASRQASAE